MSAIYTPLEAEILHILKNNIEQQAEGVAPITIMECVNAAFVKPTCLQDLEKTLLVLVKEELVTKLEDYDTNGVHAVIGYRINRDGLRAVRTINNS